MHQSTACNMHYVASSLPLLRLLQNAFLEESRCGKQLEVSRKILIYALIWIEEFSRKIKIFSCAGTGLVGGLWPGSIGWPSGDRLNCSKGELPPNPAPDLHLNLRIFEKKTIHFRLPLRSVTTNKQTSTGDQRRLGPTQSHEASSNIFVSPSAFACRSNLRFLKTQETTHNYSLSISPIFEAAIFSPAA